jgi:hypothetical protein
MADHQGVKPAPWPRERTLALRADPALLQALAAGASPCTPSACAHPDAPFSSTCLAPGAAAVATHCAPCFDALREGHEAARFVVLPVLAEGACALCGAGAGAAALRDPIGCGMAMCEGCYRGSCARQQAADAQYVPKLTVVPDEVLPGLLYISEKDGQANLGTLQRLGIRRVLICCDKLPAYHDPAASGLRYHRLAIADSMVQELNAYLPAALAFIAQGALAGEGTLVHCNAGVSRSGAVVVAFLRAAVPLSTADAWGAAMGARARVSPNGNFLRQMGYEAPAGGGGDGAAAAKCATALKECDWFGKAEWEGLCSGCWKVRVAARGAAAGAGSAAAPAAAAAGK